MEEINTDTREKERKTGEKKEESGGRERSSGWLAEFLFAEAGDGVEGALFPVAAFSLQVPDVQLVP